MLISKVKSQDNANFNEEKKSKITINTDGLKYLSLDFNEFNSFEFP